MQEKRTFMCSHCEFRFEFPADDEAQRRNAWEKAVAHEQTCPSNPLIIRVRELEARLALAVQAPAQPVADAEPLVVDGDATVEVLRLIRLECRKRSALTKNITTMVGFNNIDRLIDRIIPGGK